MSQIVKNAVYSMKRQFGVRVQLTNVSQSSTDYTTGTVTESRDTIIIKRAPILDEVTSRQFIADAMDNGFNYVKGTRLLIIDHKDLGNFVLSTETEIDYLNKSYTVDKYWPVEEAVASFLLISNIKGKDLNAST